MRNIEKIYEEHVQPDDVISLILFNNTSRLVFSRLTKKDNDKEMCVTPNFYFPFLIFGNVFLIMKINGVSKKAINNANYPSGGTAMFDAFSLALQQFSTNTPVTSTTTTTTTTTATATTTTATTTAPVEAVAQAAAAAEGMEVEKEEKEEKEGEEAKEQKTEEKAEQKEAEKENVIEKWIITLTDGEDNQSRTTPQTIASKVKDNGVNVVVISVGLLTHPGSELICDSAAKGVFLPVKTDVTAIDEAFKVVAQILTGIFFLIF